MRTLRDLVWQSLSWPSMIFHRSEATDREKTGNGIAVGRTDQGIPFAFEYHVTLTAAWSVTGVTIRSLMDERSIRLRRDQQRWYDGTGTHLGEFDNIEFIDLSISPFTNSLPINRLVFTGGTPCTIDVLYFDENRFSLRRVQQRYSRIDERTYRYRDVELADFVADIVVDEDGLVLDFPSLFRRV